MLQWFFYLKKFKSMIDESFEPLVIKGPDISRSSGWRDKFCEKRDTTCDR